MIRGIRVLRYVVIAIVLILGVYKISTNDVNIREYASALKPSAPVGTTGGLDASSDASSSADKVDKVDESLKNAPVGGTAEPYQRENATFVTLCRNSDLWNIISSVRQVEDRFNHQFHYDWVFLNDDDFTEEFKAVMDAHVSGKVVYGKIEPEHWSIPDWIDKDKAALAREKMQEDGIIYGGSLPYRHMCRFESGWFSQNAALADYKYYWRVEPDIKLFCDINYDVFKYMRQNKKSYGFTISLYEYQATIPTLWQTTKDFMAKHPEYVHSNNALGFISDDNLETYNGCHFWSNFEVGDLDLWRSQGYRDYFNYLDQAGGFFYERWGDAPVHSIAAAFLLDQDEIHYFDDIGYYHGPFMNCPTDFEVRNKLRCSCPNDVSLPSDQRDIFTFRGYSCTGKWYRFTGMERPKGWSDYSG